MAILTPHAMHPKLIPLLPFLPHSLFLCCAMIVWHAYSPIALSVLCSNIGRQPNGNMVSVYVWDYHVQCHHISNPKEPRWQWKLPGKCSIPKSAQHCITAWLSLSHPIASLVYFWPHLALISRQYQYLNQPCSDFIFICCCIWNICTETTWISLEKDKTELLSKPVTFEASSPFSELQVWQECCSIWCTVWLAT